MSGDTRVPAIVVRNAQRRLRVDVSALQRFADIALTRCAAMFPRRRQRFHALEEIVAVLVSDRRIAALHEQFMQTPGPTDVITFEHGEIVVSTETAARQAREYGTSPADELQLYVTHGLLHLLGFDDDTPRAARIMAETQQTIVAHALQQLACKTR